MTRKKKVTKLDRIPPQNRLQRIDLRDIGVIDEDPINLLREGDEKVHLKLIRDFKKKNKNRSLARYGGPRRFTFDWDNGREVALIWKNGQPLFVPFKTYETSLIKNINIPKNFVNELKRGLNDPRIADDFSNWFKNQIMKPQLDEQSFFKRLGELYEDFGFGPEENPKVDLSHYHPKSKGGRFTFLENWLVNQSRRDDVFIELSKLRQAEIPVTYSDLWHHYHKYVRGLSEPLGYTKPWYGSLENINIDDVNALSRGDQVQEVILRRRAINQILSEAKDKGVSGGSKAIFLTLDDDYKRLVQASRGFDWTQTNNEFINLEEDARHITDGIDMFDTDNPSNTANLKHKGYGYSWEPESYQRPPDIGIPDRGYNVDVDTGGPRADVSGGPMDARISPDPPKRLGLGKKLTIGSVGALGTAAIGEVGLAAFNPETAKHAGEGLKTFQETGEIDVANVKGAAAGIGTDLAKGFATRGALKIGSHLAARTAAKGAAKVALGAAMPWIGIPLLAYSIYDAADTFTEAYTGTGLNERIANNVSELFNEDNPADD